MSKEGELIYQILGLFILLIGICLGYIWFGWKLLVVLFLLTWANNIASRRGRQS